MEYTNIVESETGLEPAALCLEGRCASQLRHSDKCGNLLGAYPLLYSDVVPAGVPYSLLSALVPQERFELSCYKI